MTFTESIKTCSKNLMNFEGRASRSEYWWWYLFIYLISMALVFFFMVVAGVTAASTGDEDWILLGYGAVPFGFLLSLATLSVTVRRLHDTNRSGWWLLLWVFSYCTCGISGLVLFVLMVLEGTPTENDYGPVPPEHPVDLTAEQAGGSEAERWN